MNGEKLPRRFGRYTILAVVGEGGMARVYQAELQGPAGFRKQVCLKVLKSETTEATEETGTGESLFLIREACIVGRLKHPNIVDVYELGEVDGELFISMELVEGLTLARIIGPGRRLPGAVVMEIAVAIATGLAKAHGLVSDGRPAGLVHCDLKPSNILISWDGAVKIADFGIATTQHDEAGQSMELPEGLRGTPSFMSPEQVLGDELDGRSDLFSLALVLATTALGNNPLGGQYVFRQVLSGEPLRSPLLSEEVVSSLDEVAPGLGEVLVRCLLSDREDRYLDAEYLIRALQTVREAVGYRPGLRDWLLSELNQGTSTAPPTQELPGGLVAGRVAAGDATAVLPRQEESSKLGPRLDGFVGRESDLSAVARLVEDGVALLTIKGTGGAGKTRLCRRFARQSKKDFDGGTWFVDLTEARSAKGVLQATAAALDVRLGGDDFSALVGHLGHAIAGRGRVLLVLDNFEQVVEHAPSTVGRWLEVAPEAVFLVTSREPLRLSAEQVLPLEPLPEQDGVALFELRARAADASWEESEENRAAIHRIVEQLDGLPLAIELAAARARLLSPTQLLGRLSDRFKLLRGGRRGDTARQATLAGLIHWSWELLDPWEQAALAQLSVFRGGFFMEAAEEVLDLSAWPDAPWSLDVVGSLFDKSLLRSWKVRGQPRFGMYLSIRDYAAEKLDSLPDPANNPRHAAAVRHAAFYAGSGSEEAIDALQSHGGVERRKALALDLENLVRGVQAAGAAAEPELAACCALAAAEVFQFQGPFSDGVALLQGLLDQSVCPGTRERLYRSGGDLLRNVGRKEEAYEYFRQALAIAREVGNRRGEGRALDLLGHDVYQGGRIAEALEHYQQTLAIHREVGDRVLEGRAIGRIGYIYREQGLRAEALDYARQAIGIYREVGARHEEGVALANLAILHQEVGEFPESGELRQQALAIHRDLGDRRSEGIVLGNLAVAHQMQGELDEAVEYFHRSLAIHRELGNRRFEALDSGNLGDLLFARDDLESAESHLLEATLILDELWPAAAGAFRATLALIRARQGAFDEARSLLATGETQLRGIHKTEFGKLLCRRAQVEHLAGDAAAFMRALAEAESIAAESGSGAESELGRSIVELRALLGD